MRRSGGRARGLARDVSLLLAGSVLFAIGLDGFQVPAGLAAGGVTGLATILHALAGAPVGVVTIAVNAVMFAFVWRTRGRRYLVRTAAGTLVSSAFIDLLAPYVPELAGGDLLLAAIVGGVISGAGLGLVFRSGCNTGGVDVIAQHVAARTGFGVGSVTIVLDALVVLASIPVFSARNALYAMVSMYLSGRVTDAVIDGPHTVRAAYVISAQHERIGEEILSTLDRGCTELSAKGRYSGVERPVLFCVLGRSEVGELKAIVSEIDPEAIVFISEVYEAFGEGFRRMAE